MDEVAALLLLVVDPAGIQFKKHKKKCHRMKAAHQLKVKLTLTTIRLNLNLLPIVKPFKNIYIS